MTVFKRQNKPYVQNKTSKNFKMYIYVYIYMYIYIYIPIYTYARLTTLAVVWALGSFKITDELSKSETAAVYWLIFYIYIYIYVCCERNGFFQRFHKSPFGNP